MENHKQVDNRPLENHVPQKRRFSPSIHDLGECTAIPDLRFSLGLVIFVEAPCIDCSTSVAQTNRSSTKHTGRRDAVAVT